ncbi:MAG: PIN domain-containing protein [Deltaproteobacteria bacterium]|nr:PIN domain-containing protein [Deltaproteobacteria bacterium]
MLKAFVDTSVIMRILVKDDGKKRSASEDLIKNAKENGIALYVLPVAILEVVWVLEKIYKCGKREIREIVEAIINTPELRCELDGVFLSAIRDYHEKNIKFADAVMTHWGLDNGIVAVFTYDEKDFKRIKGLEVRRP